MAGEMLRWSPALGQDVKVHRDADICGSKHRIVDKADGFVNCAGKLDWHGLHCESFDFSLALSIRFIHKLFTFLVGSQKGVLGPTASHVLLSSFFLTLCLFLSYLFSLFFQKRKSSSSVQLMVSVLCLPQC